MPHLFCFGFGYSARVIARQLALEGWKISGTSQAEETCQKHRKQGVAACVFDGTMPLSADALEGVTHLLLSIPPKEGEDIVLKLHERIIANLPSLQCCNRTIRCWWWRNIS